MPITLKKGGIAYKNPTTGNYVPVDTLTDAGLTQKVTTLESAIAPDYANLAFPVAAGQACMYGDQRYIANQAIQTQEAWTAAHWDLAPVSNELSDLKNAITNSSENTTSAISAHAKGSLFWYSGALYVAMSAIAIGDTITTTGNTPNAAEVTIDEKLIQDIQIDGSSILNNGVANIPKGATNSFGVLKADNNHGIEIYNGNIWTIPAGISQLKAGSDSYRVISPQHQHESVYYAFSKLAGEDLKNDTVTVGIYPEKSLSAISQMLNAPVSVSGSTPSITAKAGVRYICGEVSTLTIVVPASGDIEVIFNSGSTATVLTVTPPTGVTAIKWANGFDPTSLDANTRYDLIITDGEWGMAASWA